MLGRSQVYPNGVLHTLLLLDTGNDIRISLFTGHCHDFSGKVDQNAYHSIILLIFDSTLIK